MGKFSKYLREGSVSNWKILRMIKPRSYVFIYFECLFTYLNLCSSNCKTKIYSRPQNYIEQLSMYTVSIEKYNSLNQQFFWHTCFPWNHKVILDRGHLIFSFFSKKLLKTFNWFEIKWITLQILTCFSSSQPVRFKLWIIFWTNAVAFSRWNSSFGPIEEFTYLQISKLNTEMSHSDVKLFLVCLKN